MSGSRPARGLASRVGGLLVLSTLLLMVASAVAALTLERASSGAVFGTGMEPPLNGLSFGDRLALFLPRYAGVALSMMILLATVVTSAGYSEESDPMQRRTDAVLSTGFALCLIITAAAAAMAVLVGAGVDFNGFLNAELIDRRWAGTLEYAGVAAFAGSVAWYAGRMLAGDDDDLDQADAE